MQTLFNSSDMLYLYEVKLKKKLNEELFKFKTNKQTRKEKQLSQDPGINEISFQGKRQVSLR